MVCVAENIDTLLSVVPKAVVHMQIINIRWQSLQCHIFWHYMLAFYLYLTKLIHRHDYKRLFCETGTVA